MSISEREARDRKMVDDGLNAERESRDRKRADDELKDKSRLCHEYLHGCLLLVYRLVRDVGLSVLPG